MGPKEAVQAVAGGLSEGTQVSTAKLATPVAVRPGAGGTRGESGEWTDTASAKRYHPHLGASASPQAGRGKGRASVLWGSARAELGTTTEGFCSRGDPIHCLPRRAQVRASHEYFAWRISLQVHKTQQRKAVQLQRGKQQALALRGAAALAAGNGSFH